MSIPELLEQAKTLSSHERKELAKLLIDTLDNDMPHNHGKTGAEIVSFLQTIPAIDFVDTHLEDPVGWLKSQRQKRAHQLDDYKDRDE